MGLARLASHVLRETFFFRETCLLVSEEFMFFQPKTRIPRRDVYKLLCGLEILANPSENGVEGPRHEVKNVIVKRNCAFEFLRQKCPLHVFFFVCCHVCRVCVGSLLQSSFSVHTSLIFPSQKQKSLGRAMFA